MITNSKVKLFCRDDISLIENYNEAVADTENVWVCHHRLELTLDGEFANSKQDLIRHGMYYNRPYFELIWLPDAEHRHMHFIKKALSNVTRKKLSECQTGVNNSMHGKTPWNKGMKGAEYTSHYKDGVRNSNRAKEG